MENIDFNSENWLTDTQNGIEYRLLRREDLTKEYFDLLAQLTVSPYPLENCENEEEISKVQEQMTAAFENLGQGNRTVILSAVNTETKKIVGTASLIIEQKLFRNLTKCGHIEDVVVDTTTRGKGVGSKLIQLLTECGKFKGCYKVILDCSAENMPFYEKNGFV